MGTPQPVELMTDEQVAQAFGATDGSRGGGFDELAHTRVMAYELVRSRSRLAHYRTLYTAFLEAGKPYMVENLDETQDGKAVPAKVVFADDPAEVRGLEGRADAVVWTEPQLLEALTQERTVQDLSGVASTCVFPSTVSASGADSSTTQSSPGSTREAGPSGRG